MSNTIQLNDGHSIPAIGLGTWQSKPHEVAEAVESALKAGYRFGYQTFSNMNILAYLRIVLDTSTVLGMFRCHGHNPH